MTGPTAERDRVGPWGKQSGTAKVRRKMCNSPLENGREDGGSATAEDDCLLKETWRFAAKNANRAGRSSPDSLQRTRCGLAPAADSLRIREAASTSNKSPSCGPAVAPIAARAHPIAGFGRILAGPQLAHAASVVVGQGPSELPGMGDTRCQQAKRDRDRSGSCLLYRAACAAAVSPTGR